MIPQFMMVIFQSLEKLLSSFFKCSSQNKKSFLYVYLVCLCTSHRSIDREWCELVSNIGQGKTFIKP